MPLKRSIASAVLFPILLLFGIDTTEAINQPLDRPEEARQRLPVALEDTKHVDADGLGYSKNYECDKVISESIQLLS